MEKFISLLKYGLVTCMMLTMSSKGYAQISDLDAKLAFQKITDAYEASAYYSAATQAEQLKNKMGSWNPKVLYIYLQSAYKAYNGGKAEDNKFGTQHYTFTAFKNAADLFFTQIDKDYPKDKIADMVTAQKYFTEMAKQSAYQTERTPEKAIAFLNDCAYSYRNYRVGGLGGDFSVHDPENDKTMDGMPYIHFRLDSAYLRIVMVTKTKNAESKYNRAVIWNDLIDLKHSPAIDEGKITPDDRVYIFSHHDLIFNTRGNFDKTDTTAAGISWRDGKKFANYKLLIDKNNFSEEPQTTLVYPILILFNGNSKNFQDNDYANRIKDAFNYLLNYYPKEKSPAAVVKKKEEKRSNGF